MGQSEYMKNRVRNKPSSNVAALIMKAKKDSMNLSEQNSLRVSLVAEDEDSIEEFKA